MVRRKGEAVTLGVVLIATTITSAIGLGFLQTGFANVLTVGGDQGDIGELESFESKVESECRASEFLSGDLGEDSFEFNNLVSLEYDDSRFQGNLEDGTAWQSSEFSECAIDFPDQDIEPGTNLNIDFEASEITGKGVGIEVSQE